ncbi:MAG: dihydrofolate reductase family protein, partial [Planctomycetaceae bacterium]|nr:dihydrofolate reductase family protein [Planctomycetaceae bacterium]
FFDARLIDETHLFIAPKLIGGSTAPSPIGGLGIDLMQHALPLRLIETQTLDDNLYLQARLDHPQTSA